MADEPVVTPGETPTPTAAGETPEAKPVQLTPEQYQAELASAKQRIADLNKESAKHRKAAEALEKAEADRKTEAMSETDKLQAKVKAAEDAQTAAFAKANARMLRAVIMEKAAGQFVDVEDVVNNLSTKLTVNDDGEVDGLDDALKELAKAKPHWLAKARPVGSATNPGGAAQTGETEAQQRARVYGSGASQMFNVQNAYANGGGVIMDPQSPKQQT